jgi:hypothetical protein
VDIPDAYERLILDCIRGSAAYMEGRMGQERGDGAVGIYLSSMGQLMDYTWMGIRCGHGGVIAELSGANTIRTLATP